MENLTISFQPLSAPEEPIEAGSRSLSTAYAVTRHHLTYRHRPFLPVMGEFHYSRWPADEWELSLRKMKACGITIVATYVFWIHHEEERGIWRTDGNLDLRRFLSLCRDVGLQVFLRIGPWAHGECRHGGFPDWLQHDPTLRLRTNDPAYLDLVRGFYGHIFEMARGFMLDDGGPILGIQLENEYGHCGGEHGEAGMAHMRMLKEIAVETGFRVPYYTATGWGGANVVAHEMLPVMGGYVDAPWERSLDPILSPNFLLLPARNDPLIGNDYGAEEKLTFPPEDYPYLTCELGGGLQCTKLRRPLVSAMDTYAQALCKLGSGANLLGYYMFHGGTHPMGRHSSMQESTASGSYTDVPVRSYDFQAPIGESGETHASYALLRVLHAMIHAVSASLAGSMTYFPDHPVTDPEDTRTLRFSVRYHAKTEEGFVFICNHQRGRTMAAHPDTRLTIHAGNRTYELPPVNIAPGACLILPFDLRCPSGRILTTNCQLLGFLGARPVLFPPEGQTPVVTTEGTADPILISQADALRASFVQLRGCAQPQLVFSDGSVLEDGDRFLLLSQSSSAVCRMFPDTVLHLSVPSVAPEGTLELIEEAADHRTYRVDLPDMPRAETVQDLILTLDYTGDRAEVYLDGELIADWFTTGQPFRMALRRWHDPRSLEVRIFPVTEPTYFETPVPRGMTLNNVSLTPVYRLHPSFPFLDGL